MKFEKYIIPFKEGMMEDQGTIRMSSSKGGCGIKGCQCSPGYWLSIIMPVNDNNEVEITKVQFDDKKEFLDFVIGNKLTTHEKVEGQSKI